MLLTLAVLVFVEVPNIIFWLIKVILPTQLSINTKPKDERTIPTVRFPLYKWTRDPSPPDRSPGPPPTSTYLPQMWHHYHRRSGGRLFEMGVGLSSCCRHQEDLPRSLLLSLFLLRVLSLLIIRCRFLNFIITFLVTPLGFRMSLKEDKSIKGE